MGGNYEKSIYNQLMEVMARLDAVEQDLHTESNSSAFKIKPIKNDRKK